MANLEAIIAEKSQQDNQWRAEKQEVEKKKMPD